MAQGLEDIGASWHLGIVRPSFQHLSDHRWIPKYPERKADGWPKIETSTWKDELSPPPPDNQSMSSRQHRHQMIEPPECNMFSFPKVMFSYMPFVLNCLQSNPTRDSTSDPLQKKDMSPIIVLLKRKLQQLITWKLKSTNTKSNGY